jgi:hypothetical protein
MCRRWPECCTARSGGREPADVFGLNRRDDHRPIGKLLEQQAAHYAQEHAARLRREAANMVHVVVVAAQLLVHRGRSRWWLGDDGVGAQNDKQMPLPEANFAARVTMVR